MKKATLIKGSTSFWKQRTKYTMASIGNNRMTADVSSYLEQHLINKPKIKLTVKHKKLSKN